VIAALYPDTAAVSAGRLLLDGIDSEALAERFGTPLYVYDAATLATQARAYQEPLAPIGGRVVFAAKANPTVGVLRTARAAGLGVDVASAGEIAAALAAGFHGSEMVVHGNAKGSDDLAAALDAGAGLVVLDAREEAEQLGALARARGVDVPVLIRVTPDIGVETHEKVQTGHAGSKFGLEPDAVAALIAALPGGLLLRGLHVHLGSQVVDPGPLSSAAEWCAAFCARLGYAPSVLDLGGGLGVAYVPGEASPDPRAYATALADAVPAAFAAHRLAVPQLVVEPGRSIVARAGVTLYRVRTVKVTSAGTTWVTVDGGMADNPRVALYGARYAPAIATRLDAAPTGTFALAGRHCESGDLLALDVALPDPRVGDLVVVPMTGAYHQSMASNYNLFGRPAAILLEDGVAHEITRRETAADMLARETGRA
jgi:diaminopimelate decarboxylase